MVDKPQISVVMPVRNREDLIAKSIQSIVNQTIQDWELVVIDDSSEDQTKIKRIVSKFEDNRIRYYRLPFANGYGQAAARNFGNMLARGEYIAVMDSDDLSSADRVELTLYKFKETGCDLVYGNLILWYPENNLTRLCDDKIRARPFDLKYFKKWDYIPHATVAYTKKIALDFPYNSFFTRACDYDFLSRLSKYGYKFEYINSILLNYRQHKGSISKSPALYPFNDIIRYARGWTKTNPLERDK